MAWQHGKLVWASCSCDKLKPVHDGELCVREARSRGGQLCSMVALWQRRLAGARWAVMPCKIASGGCNALFPASRCAEGPRTQTSLPITIHRSMYGQKQGFICHSGRVNVPQWEG
eukprot:349676-Chlamydomonas_euryale.AAC.1